MTQNLTHQNCSLMSSWNFAQSILPFCHAAAMAKAKAGSKKIHGKQHMVLPGLSIHWDLASLIGEQTHFI